MKIGLLFSGQGAQTVGMGKDLAAVDTATAELFARANEILGYDLARIAFEGPKEELTRTAVAQPALYVHSYACWQALKRRVPALDFVAAAGLSLGEFTAHAVAGTFTFEDGLRLVQRRAEAMQRACDETEGGMVAIIGAEEDGVRALAAAADVDVANYNSPGQVVISGEAAKIAVAVGLAKEYGARKAVELTVAGAFHSRLMESAYVSLKEALAATPMNAPRVPVVCNVDAIAVTTPDTIRDALAEQVTSSVCWTDSIAYMVERLGCMRFIECGPGAVLAGFVARINKNVPVVSVADCATLEAAVAQLS